VIGLDTNVLVRYIAQDDAKQAPLATRLVEGLSSENPAFITTVTLVELVWVMQSSYRAPKAEIVAILELILRTRQFVVENAETAMKAIALFSNSKADFSDCLIERTASRAGCSHTVTFDKNAAKFGDMQLLT
jgi:predicted nucleic-acid-binding protein